MRKNKILVFIATILLVLSAIFAYFAYVIYKDKNIEIKDYAITNITGTGFTVTWKTDEPTISKVFVTEKGGDTNILKVLTSAKYYDDRDIEQNEDGEWITKSDGLKKRYTHHVTIRGLDFNHEYEVMIIGKIYGLKYDMDTTETKEYEVQTTEILDNLKTPDPAYGKVLNFDRTKQDPIDGIVYVQLLTPGDLAVMTQIYSAPISKTHTFSIDLNNMYTKEGGIFKRGEDSQILIKVITDKYQEEKRFMLQDYKPLPIIFVNAEGEVGLNKNNLNNGLLSKAYASPTCGFGQCEAGGACYADGWCCAHNTADSSRPYGTYICRAGDWQWVSELPVGVLPQRYISHGSDKCDLEPCEETYKESCTKEVDGQIKLGTKTCYKTGQSPCGVSGPACSWGAGSYCGECDTDNETRDYDSELLQHLAQESEMRSEYLSDGNIFNIENWEDARITLLSIALQSNNCVDGDSLYTVGCIYQENNTCYGIEKGGSSGLECRYIERECPEDVNNKEACRYDEDLSEESETPQDEEESQASLKQDSMPQDAVIEENDLPEGVEIPITQCVIGNLNTRTYVILDTNCGGINKSNETWRISFANSQISYYYKCILLDEASQTYNLDNIFNSRGDSGDPCIVSVTGYNFNEDILLADKSKLFDSNDRLNNKFLSSVLAIEQKTDDNLEITSSGKYAVYVNEDVPIGEFTIDINDGEAVRVKLFFDENGNGIKDDGEKELEDYTQIKLQKESEAVVWSLSEGWNLISIPLFSDKDINTASKLLDEFNSQGADIKHIARYTDTGFEIFTKREGDVEFSNDFNINPGHGYFVLNYNKTNVSLTGKKYDESVPVRIHNGWNLVGIYTNGEKRTAGDIIKKMGGQSIKADIMSRYTDGRYESIVYEKETLYGNDYDIVEKSGYFIRIQDGGGVKFTP